MYYEDFDTAWLDTFQNSQDFNTEEEGNEMEKLFAKISKKFQK